MPDDPIRILIDALALIGTLSIEERAERAAAIANTALAEFLVACEEISLLSEDEAEELAGVQADKLMHDLFGKGGR